MHYKAFNQDMTCRGYQFEIGKTYSIKGELTMCKNGFHCCENIINCLSYYPKRHSRFCEVEVSEEHITDGVKTVARTINIIREITGDELSKALTGQGKLLYTNGTLFSTVDYKNGVFDGERNEYWDNNNISISYSYKNGKRVGLQREWYRNGQPKLEYSYMDTEKYLLYTGAYTSWFENGQICEKKSYNMGDRIGEYIQYYKTGQIYKKTVYTATGSPNSDIITYYENGQIMRHESGNTTLGYYPDGFLRSKTQYTDDEKTHIEYYPDGFMRSKTHYTGDDTTHIEYPHDE